MSELARIETQDRGVLFLVQIIGEIDLSNAREVMYAVLAQVPHEASLVVVDLSDITYLDSAGVAMIFRLAERVRFARQQLRLVVPADAPIRVVVDQTNMSRVIPIEDTIDAQDTDTTP
ncbi:MAG: STAS domain-containing protein [Nocardioidaceae bacterium]